jgi:hypothetical protein
MILYLNTRGMGLVRERDVLEQRVLSAGRRMYRILGRMTLPEPWIDDLNAIEAGFGLWVKAERWAIENEWTRFKQEEKQTQGAVTSVNMLRRISSDKRRHLKEPATKCYDRGVVIP